MQRRPVVLEFFVPGFLFLVSTDPFVGHVKDLANHHLLWFAMIRLDLNEPVNQLQDSPVAIVVPCSLAIYKESHGGIQTDILFCTYFGVCLAIKLGDQYRCDLVHCCLVFVVGVTRLVQILLCRKNEM